MSPPTPVSHSVSIIRNSGPSTTNGTVLDRTFDAGLPADSESSNLALDCLVIQGAIRVSGEGRAATISLA